MAKPIDSVPSQARPWARGVDNRLDKAELVLKNLGYSVSSMPDADKAVFYEFSTGQNIALGTNGRVEPSAPIAVRYTSSTGMFEVTVSLAGLTRDGAILGASFESVEVPYAVYFDMPTYGVTSSAPIGETNWSPFSASYSTVLSTRPGLQELSMYFYSVCTAGANSAAFVKRARLSVKAV